MQLRSIFFLFFILVVNSNSITAQTVLPEEWIKVYFNMPGDTTVMHSDNREKSTSDLIGTLEELIDSASFSVDLNIYDFEHIRIANALANAVE